MRTRVKICGFTRCEDAAYAASLGVDAIGLVFYPPSPRYVNLEQAAAIARSLPAFVSVVALFVNAEPTLIRQVLQQVPVDCLQFHGEEQADACRLYGKPYIKALRMQTDTQVSELENQFQDASGLLLDAYHPQIQGGTGDVFDWDLIPVTRSLPIILAGGLTAENAAQAIRTVKPYALDVSSSVEAEKGIKDVAKMAAFIRITNQAIEI
jgi:phosphoribosylanthranilate isomerase